MHVLVATDGTLDAQRTAPFAARLAGEGGRVTVFTAVEVPRQILLDLRAASAPDPDPANVDVEYRRQQAADAPMGSWIGDDAFVAMYVKRVVANRTVAIVTELESLGVEASGAGLEGENAARTVLDAVTELEADVLCIGTLGLGRFEGLLGSISTKLARLAPCPVMLIR